jgi:nicotinamide phosphoribosyltransferase
VNFAGTDTLEGIKHAMKYYYADVCGFSVPAAEHSTVTIYKKENESKAYERFIDVFPDGILSIVCDSYDTINAVDNIFGKELKAKILSRNGKLVARPDSGDPVKIVVQVLEALWRGFGGTVNAKGYKVLNPCVGVIYGDGINYDSIGWILKAIMDAGFAIENVVFGEGGALLQLVNRDTFNFAFKCSAAKIDGMWRDVYKQPKTMSAKNSKPGRHKLIRNNRTFVTVSYVDFYTEDDELKTVFENGKLIINEYFNQIRHRAESYL